MGKILLIEDEAGIRRTLTVSLMQEGYEVEPCEDGLTGLSKIDNHVKSGKTFDAVILDIFLPDINGLKVLRFLKEKHPEIPVIMISGYGDESTLDEIKLRRGDAYLEKPVVMDRLDAYLRDLIARKDEILGGKKATATRDPKTATKSGYAFVRISDEEHFLPVFQKLYFHTNVMYCDAVRGSFDIVLLLHGKSVAELEQAAGDIGKIDGVREVSFATVEMPVLSEDLTKVIREMERFLLDSGSPKAAKARAEFGECSAYALLEIEPGGFEKVYRQLYFLDNVISCDSLKGTYQMAVLLKAQGFAEIDGIVTGRIARIDGVLRVSQCDIVKLLEM